MKPEIPRTTALALALVLHFMWIGGAALATDFYVPTDVPTIQGAIGFALDGDRVLVEPGTYFEELDYLGKDIILESTGGPAVTILDGSLIGDSIVRMIGVDGAVIRGFTLRDGGAWNSMGGVFAVKGGAIRASGYPRIEGNIFVNNLAYWGGAVLIENVFTCCGQAVISGNEFLQNQARQGGAVGVQFVTDLLIERNVFRENLAIDFSGALSEGEGGALFLLPGETLQILDNLFLANTAEHVIEGVAFGGAVFLQFSAITPILFRGNTFIGNVAAYRSTIGGFGLDDCCLIENCLFWQNPGLILGEQDLIGTLSSVLSVDYSLTPGFTGGVGNIDADPLVVYDAGGLPYLSHVSAGQPATSPCIDAGDPLSPIPPGGVTRIDGVPDAGVVDIGYHHPPASASFIRGDFGGDGLVNIADAIATLEWLFLIGISTPSCQDACDANDDGAVDIADPIRTLMMLFVGGPTLPVPHPSCGVDSTGDGLGCAPTAICP